MVIEIRVDAFDWQIYIYGIDDVVGKYISFKDVLDAHGYNYNQVILHWKNKKHVNINETNSFISIDDKDEIYVIKFGCSLYVDTSYPYEMVRSAAPYSTDVGGFLSNIKNVLDISRRDEKIKSIFNI